MLNHNWPLASNDSGTLLTVAATVAGAMTAALSMSISMTGVFEMTNEMAWVTEMTNEMAGVIVITSVINLFIFYKQSMILFLRHLSINEEIFFKHWRIVCFIKCFKIVKGG